MDDWLDDFIVYDAIVGADMVKCQKCGACVDKSILLDDEVKCPQCGEVVKS